ncbi:hypothetical protein SAMN05660657_01204 [Geodermatophilus amargosae]|uniref:Gamma-glutamyl cyclotransferase, AIG2-like n=1 Tax=Geodermatophilus amargosae TaxID=1296565 RepID=A0A1I6YL89_9ACTN|nr:hypothetical protein [Geodermatophilus amargosae]SFT51263.1 hypothetical protein SAMN05660657_01204 [Geodermatophilus amargosae]
MVEVEVLESADLPAPWSRWDAFEGTGYERVLAPVATDGGDVEAYLYVHLAPDGG